MRKPELTDENSEGNLYLTLKYIVIGAPGILEMHFKQNS